MNIQDAKLMNELDKRQSPFYSKIEEVYREVEDVLNNRISFVFPYYTQHDTKHSLRIMGHMYEIIEDITKLNDLEITLLIYSALLHDIGMAASEDEIQKIKNGELQYEGLSYELLLKQFSNNHTLAIQEFVREVHAYRSSEYIKNNLGHYFIIPNAQGISFANELAKICEAHTKDFLWVVEELDENTIKGSFTINPQFCAMLLRLGDILDFDSLRTPGRLFEAARPLGYSLQEWKQHFIIQNTQKVVKNERGIKVVTFYGTCEEPKIHRKVLNYLDWVETEINNALEISEEFKNEHRFNLHFKVNNFIESQNYKIVDLKFDFNYLNVMKILMGEELYGNKKYGLREIVQNSIDACNHRRTIYKQFKEPWENDYEGKICIILKKSTDELIIKDNGIGMNYSIIKRYFLDLGSSYYKSKEFKVLDSEYKPIGNYGIGFLAAFMISSKVSVRTKHFNSSSIIELEIEKDEQYVAMKEIEKPNFEGTEIILNLTEVLEIWDSNIEELLGYLNESFLLDNIKVHLLSEDKALNYETIEINNTDISEAVDLSKYLDEVELKVKYSRPKKIFKNYLSDCLNEEALLMEDGHLKFVSKDDETIALKSCLENSKLNLIEVMLIQGEEMLSSLEKALDVYESDGDEIHEYLWNNFSPSYIEVVNKARSLKRNSVYYMEKSREIIGFDIEEINKLGNENLYHDNKLGTVYTKNEYDFFEVDEIDKCIEIDNTEIETELLHWNIPQDNSYRKLFVRGVFVKKFSTIYIKNKINDLLINEIKVNIINPSIIPTVNRNFLKEDDELKIDNSIYIAVCLNILDNTEDYLEKMLLRRYLDETFDFSKSLIKLKFYPNN